MIICVCNNNNNKSTITHSREDDGTEEKGKLNSLLLCIKILYIILFTNFCISRLKFSDKKKKNGKFNSLLLCIKILYRILCTNFCISRLKFQRKAQMKIPLKSMQLQTTKPLILNKFNVKVVSFFHYFCSSKFYTEFCELTGDSFLTELSNKTRTKPTGTLRC